jgi:hypothetical protein
MGTTERLKVAKEILATSFLNATERSLAHGLQYSYKSYPVETSEFRGWIVDIIVKEAGYGEHVIQQFKYEWPNNIDPKNLEYNVVVDVISSLTQGCLISWYEVAKYLASDSEIQKKIIDEAKEDNIASY